jgi:hypothetical protein
MVTMKRQGNGTVYIVGNKERGLYRIGWTNNHLDVRLAQMHRENAFPVMEIASSWVKDASQVEAQLKKLFLLNRVLGGWFLLMEKDLAIARRILGLDLF